MKALTDDDLFDYSGGHEGFGSAQKPRSRGRDRAGKSDRSWLKQREMGQAAWGQASVLARVMGGRGAIIDHTAGDGVGVEMPDGAFDFYDNTSVPTPQIAVSIANRLPNCRAFLCDSNFKKREMLRQTFDPAIIFSSHKVMRRHLIDYGPNWAVTMDDPCGPSDHDLDGMRALGEICLTDYVIANNLGAINRLLGMADEADDSHLPNANQIAACRRAKATYAPMLTSAFWLRELGCKHLSWTKQRTIAPAFKCRIIVAADYLSDAARRRPFEVQA